MKTVGKQTKTNRWTSQSFIPIAMMHVTVFVYSFVEEWEPEDLFLRLDYGKFIEQGSDYKDEIERAFGRKHRLYVSIYVPTESHSYLAIDFKLFSNYVGDELWDVYDLYIAQFSKCHPHLDKFHEWCNVLNTDMTLDVRQALLVLEMFPLKVYQASDYSFIMNNDSLCVIT